MIVLGHFFYAEGRHRAGGHRVVVRRLDGGLEVRTPDLRTRCDGLPDCEDPREAVARHYDPGTLATYRPVTNCSRRGVQC